MYKRFFTQYHFNYKINEIIFLIFNGTAVFKMMIYDIKNIRVFPVIKCTWARAELDEMVKYVSA